MLTNPNLPPHSDMCLANAKEAMEQVEVCRQLGLLDQAEHYMKKAETWTNIARATAETFYWQNKANIEAQKERG